MTLLAFVVLVLCIVGAILAWTERWRWGITLLAVGLALYVLPHTGLHA